MIDATEARGGRNAGVSFQASRGNRRGRSGQRSTSAPGTPLAQVSRSFQNESGLFRDAGFESSSFREPSIEPIVETREPSEGSLPPSVDQLNEGEPNQARELLNEPSIPRAADPLITGWKKISMYFFNQ